MGNVAEYPGVPLTMYKITPGDVLTGVPAGLYKYVEHEIGYDSGDYAFLEGDVMIGASSGAVGIVISCTVVTGTVGTSDAAGKIRFHSWNGVNFTDNEHFKVAADNDVGDVDGSVPSECTDNYPFKGSVAIGVIVCAQTYAQRVGFGLKKVRPDQTSTYGLSVAAGDSFLIRDASAVKNIMVVDSASGSAGSTLLIGLF